jgi:hypothetical protein
MAVAASQAQGVSKRAPKSDAEIKQDVERERTPVATSRGYDRTAVDRFIEFA